jgi:hypothetical protein
VEFSDDRSAVNNVKGLMRRPDAAFFSALPLDIFRFRVYSGVEYTVPLS